MFEKGRRRLSREIISYSPVFKAAVWFRGTPLEISCHCRRSSGRWQPYTERHCLSTCTYEIHSQDTNRDSDTPSKYICFCNTLTFNFFNFHFPGNAGCLKIFKVTLKFHPFLKEKKNAMKTRQESKKHFE